MRVRAARSEFSIVSLEFSEFSIVSLEFSL